MLERARLPAVDGDVLLQARGATVHSEKRHSNSYAGNQLPSSSASLPRRPTTEVQNICGQRHDRVVLSLVRELALDGNSSWPWKLHGTIFNFSYHDFLVVWSKVIEATRLGDFIQPLVPYMARHSGPSIDAAWVPEHACFDTHSEHGTTNRSTLQRWLTKPML